MCPWSDSIVYNIITRPYNIDFYYYVIKTFSLYILWLSIGLDIIDINYLLNFYFILYIKRLKMEY